MKRGQKLQISKFARFRPRLVVNHHRRSQMLKFKGIEKTIQLSGMAIGVGTDGKLAVEINPRAAVEKTMQQLITNLCSALMPLVQQGVELPDVKMPKDPPADPIEYVTQMVTFVAVDGLKAQVAAQKQAAAEAAATRPAANEDTGIAPAVNDVNGIQRSMAGAAVADSGTRPVAATADAATAPASNTVQ